LSASKSEMSTWGLALCPNTMCFTINRLVVLVLKRYESYCSKQKLKERTENALKKRLRIEGCAEGLLKSVV
jgi:hypothetical protein